MDRAFSPRRLNHINPGATPQAGMISGRWPCRHVASGPGGNGIVSGVSGMAAKKSVLFRVVRTAIMTLTVLVATPLLLMEVFYQSSSSPW